MNKQTPLQNIRSEFRLVLALVAGMAAISSSQAIFIGFEPDEGYSAGNLTGQPSGGGTQWVYSQGHPQVITVAAGLGAGGSQAAYLGLTDAPNEVVDFSPSEADMGGIFDGESSILAFSFDIVWETLNPGVFSPLGSLYLGNLAFTDRGLRFEWDNSGKLTFYTGNLGPVLAKNGGGETLIATAGSFYEVSAIANYGTGDFTLSVGGVDQGTFNLSGSDADTASPNIHLISYAANDASRKSGTAIDNIP